MAARSTARLVFILRGDRRIGAALFFVVPTVTAGTAGAEAAAFGTQFSADAFAAFAKMLIYLAGIACLAIAPAFLSRVTARCAANIPC